MPKEVARTVGSRTKRAVDQPPDDAERTPLGDHLARRGLLLEAASQVIARDGYSGASLRKVAAEAGLTTGKVSCYFANKDEMVAAIAPGYTISCGLP